MSGEFGEIFQQGYIVADVKQRALEWAQQVGAGPFYVLDSLRMDEYHYRGQRVPVEMCLAFGYWGHIQIELIQPLGSATTLYSEALSSGGEKLNHCATIVPELDQLLTSKGLTDRVIQSGSMPTGLKFVYLENYLPDGSHLELIQATEQAVMGFQGMEAVHRAWNGANPVRSIADLGTDLAALRQG